MKMIMQKSAKISGTIRRVCDHFDAIAGRDNHALFYAGMRGKIAAAIGEA
jgi:hypothetical protein